MCLRGRGDREIVGQERREWMDEMVGRRDEILWSCVILATNRAECFANASRSRAKNSVDNERIHHAAEIMGGVRVGVTLVAALLVRRLESRSDGKRMWRHVIKVFDSR